MYNNNRKDILLNAKHSMVCMYVQTYDFSFVLLRYESFSSRIEMATGIKKKKKKKDMRR